MIKRGFEMVGKFLLAFIISDLLMRLTIYSEHLISDLTSNRKEKIIRKILL